MNNCTPNNTLLSLVQQIYVKKSELYYELWLLQQLFSGSTGGNLDLNVLDILMLSGNTLYTQYNTQVQDSLTSSPVWAVPQLPASVWKSKNMVDVMDTILFPTRNPTYTIPTLTLSGSVNGVQEVGSIVSPIFIETGIKNDAGIFTQLSIQKIFSGITTIISTVNNPSSATATTLPTQYTFNDPNNPNLKFIVVTGDTIIVPPPTSTYFSTIEYQGTSVYLSGLTKLDNRGSGDTRSYDVRNVNAPQSGSSTLNTSLPQCFYNIIRGIYPYFYGISPTKPTVSQIVSFITGGTANKVVADAHGTIGIVFSATNHYLWFAHYSGNTTKIKWFVDKSNTNFIKNNNPFSNLFSEPTLSLVNSPTGLWSNINFNIYISNYATTTTSPPNSVEIMQMQNS